MSKSDRTNSRIGAMEADYRRLLMAALEACARGRWGLFGQNDHLMGGRPRTPEVDEILELGEAISRLRANSGLPAFELHERFIAARGRKGDNEPGEPKTACVWLAELQPAG